MSEKYNPTEEDYAKAESMMTADQKKDSEIREKNWEQEQAPWEPFDDENIDENFERKTATPEQVADMDKRLAELADAFKDSSVNWHMDGALNISLMNGKYIGNHKDVDLSVEKNELAELEAQLLKNGFGLFLSRTEDRTKNKIMRRVGHSDFAKSDAEHMLIAAINKDGEIRRDMALNFLDVHVVDRNEDGQALGYAGVAIPDKWAMPYPVEYQGKQLNLSHPGKVLYYKMHQGRGYDKTDIKRLIETGKVTEEDVDDIEKTFELEFVANVKKGREIFEKVANQLTPEMSVDQILDTLVNQPELGKDKEQMKKSFLPFAEKIFESEVKSAEAMTNIAIKLFGVTEKNNKKREEIKAVRQLVSDEKKIRQVREELKG